MTRYFSITCFAFLFSFFSFAQNLPDVNALIIGKNPEQQINILDSLNGVYKNSDIAFAFRCINKALALSEQNELYGLEAKNYRLRAGLHKKNKNTDSVLADFSAGEKILQQHNLSEELSDHYNAWGGYYYRIGDYKNASQMQFKAVEEAEKVNYKEGLAFAYNSIGGIFFHETNFDKAIEYFTHALDIHKEQGNKKRMALSYDNIGLCYSNKNDLPKALSYQRMAVKTLEEAGDKFSLGEGYYNLGCTYTLLQKYDTALACLAKAVSFGEETKNEIGLANAYNQLGIVEYKLKNYSTAIDHLIKAFELANRLELKNQLKDAALYLSYCYEQKKDFVSSLKYQKMYADLLDKMYSEENTNTIKELSEKYQSEKKQKEIELLQKENQLKDVSEQKLKFRNTALIGIALLILALAGFILWRFLEKKKDNNLLAEKNTAIAEQKQEIEEKNKSITDSIVYARRIQFSVLPSENVVKDLLPDCFVYYIPKDIISGDFYWLTTRNDLIYLAVADCTGHGVPGALMSMLGTSFLNQIVLEKNISNTNDILKELHSMVLTTLNENLEHRNSKDGMDCSLIRIDKRKREIQFSGAGRPLYLVKDNKLDIIKADKMSIGGVYDVSETNYMAHSIKIEKGLKLYLFSDGIPDQFGGPKQKKLTVKNLQGWIDKNHTLSMQEQKNNFATFMQEWKGNVEQIDDMTFVGIDFTKLS